MCNTHSFVRLGLNRTQAIASTECVGFVQCTQRCEELTAPAVEVEDVLKITAQVADLPDIVNGLIRTAPKGRDHRLEAGLQRPSVDMVFTGRPSHATWRWVHFKADLPRH